MSDARICDNRDCGQTIKVPEPNRYHVERPDDIYVNLGSDAPDWDVCSASCLLALASRLVPHGDPVPESVERVPPDEVEFTIKRARALIAGILDEGTGQVILDRQDFVLLDDALVELLGNLKAEREIEATEDAEATE